MIRLPLGLERAALRLGLGLPRGLRRALLGAPPLNDRGQPYDPDAWLMTWMDRHLQPPLVAPEPAQARENMRRAVALISPPRRGLPFTDERVAGVPCRRWAGPPGAPVIVYLHGGGWVVGDLDSHHPLCERLRAEAGWGVISVDYRLAPEHPFPAGLEDTLAVLEAVLEEAEGPVLVGGDSAGGNLAAAACLRRREEGRSLPALQLLIYPGLDLRRQTASHRHFAEGFLLTAADIDGFMGWLGAPDLLDPQVSPGLVEDPAGLPPTVMVTAGFDPFRDEGEAFADRLEEAGVPLRRVEAPSLPHGFANMDGALPAASGVLSEALGAAAELLEVALSPPGGPAPP